MRDSVLIYRSFWEALKNLDDSDRLSAITAIIEYGLDGIEPDVSGVAAAMFVVARPLIDKNNKRYENGKKGGKPSNNQNVTKDEPNQNQEETKSEPNVNVNVNVKDNVNANINTSCPEAETAPCSTQKIAASFILNDGSMYNVTENDVETYQQLYPGIDCMQEIRNMVGWCDANPKNRKTRSGAKRFMNAWLSRAQNSAKKEPTRSQRTISNNQFHNFDQRNHDDNYYDALMEQMRRTQDVDALHKQE